ncbi:MAG: DUF1987 domain-containing protein [Bacteroidales bacterium]|jgi:hypothetical protein|nr:DUF1987 domain-containing protein [Bacteroidales bacterium]
MESLFIQATEETPAVDYNIETGVFKLTGRSLPENAIDFYAPILAWSEQLLSESEPQPYIFEFFFEYFNTASSKQIVKMLLMMEKFIDKHTLIVRWMYEPEDTDMLNMGEQYSKILKLPFELIEKSIDTL